MTGSHTQQRRRSSSAICSRTTSYMRRVSRPSRQPRWTAAASSTAAYGFSWRIFAITTGDQQLAFTDGANSNRVLGYSGALAGADVSSLPALAQAGDRLTKLTLTFSYGSTDPDVGLSLASAVDYRETQNVIKYVPCSSACSLAKASSSGSRFALVLFGLAMVGVLIHRRRRG